MISLGLLARACGVALVSANIAAAAQTTPKGAGQHDITFTGDTVYAESVTWSVKQHRFFVGSIRHGTVGAVTPGGKYTPFIHDPDLVTTLGVRIDDRHNTLWVTNVDIGASEHSSPATQGKLTGVAAYNATTGKRIAYADLGHLSEGAHLANDVAVDANGDAYVTDSFAPIVYRVDKAGKASIFAQSPMFFGGPGPFNLNGIVYHPDGYLLVGKHNSGDLFRVDLADPTKIVHVKIPDTLKGMDGITLVDPQHLVAVLNVGVSRSVELVSTDGWASATIVRETPSALTMPTAATVAGKTVFILNSRLDTLSDPKAAKVSEFLLQKF